MNTIVIITGVLTAIIIVGFMIWATIDYLKKRNIDIREDVKEGCKEKEAK